MIGIVSTYTSLDLNCYEIKKVRVKILTKYISGWVFKRPKLTVEILENVMPKYTDISVSRALYGAAKINSIWIFPREYKKDGSWHFV